jgi:Rps23 Pro-64 3,4-dihydroxylase Tpa1-like proline 4-hydroxylase
MIVRRKKISNKIVRVVDGLFTHKELISIYRVLKNLPYKKEMTTRMYGRNKHLAAMIHPYDIDEIDDFKFYAKIHNLILRFYNNKYKMPFTCHVSQRYHGDYDLPHPDCPPRYRDITILYYANPTWDDDWGGMTMCFDPDSPYNYAIRPKPGRILVFPGTMKHQALPPNKQCTQARYVFVSKYSLNKDAYKINKLIPRDYRFAV